VDYKVDIINQHPLGLVVALDVCRAQSRVFQAQFYFVGNGLNLPRISPAAQHEVVGKRSRPFLHFQDTEFFALFFKAGLDNSGDLLLQFALLHSVVGKLVVRR